MTLIDTLGWLAWNTPYCVAKRDVVNKRDVYLLYERKQHWRSAWIEIDKDTERITAYGDTRWKERYAVLDTMDMPTWASEHLQRAPQQDEIQD